jgi:hypothetical protein
VRAAPRPGDQPGHFLVGVHFTPPPGASGLPIAVAGGARIGKRHDDKRGEAAGWASSGH